MPSTAPNETPTRERLLLASLRAFGRNDYEAVSTRQIVEQAETNISGISYHFGGKQQLYLATAEFLARSIRTGQEATLSKIQKQADSADPERCRMLLAELIEVLVRDILAGELSADAAGFIFREQLQPTAAFDILYRELMDPIHDLYARLLACALGLPPDNREIKLMGHALLGQIISFRIAQSTLLRRLESNALATADIAQIADIITHNTLAAIDARLARKP